jgi:hypothetical protein
LLTGSIFALAAAIIALRTSNTRGETDQHAVTEPLSANAQNEEVPA